MINARAVHGPTILRGNKKREAKGSSSNEINE